MIKKIQYRIYCVTEKTHVLAFLEAPPETCPNDPAHEVKAESVTLISSPGAGNILSKVNDAASGDEQRERVLAFLDKFSSFQCCIEQACIDEAKEKIQAGLDAGILTTDDQALIESFLPS